MNSMQAIRLVVPHGNLDDCASTVLGDVMSLNECKNFGVFSVSASVQIAYACPACVLCIKRECLCNRHS